MSHEVLERLVDQDIERGLHLPVGADVRGGAGFPPMNGAKRLHLRIFSFRHGTREHNRPADAYRLNVGFFDGHVETLGDLEAADPALWAPRGTAMTAADAYPDVHQRYFAGRPNPYIAP